MFSGRSEVQHGFKDADGSGDERLPSKGWCARYRPTESFLELCAGFGITPDTIGEHFAAPAAVAPLIMVKKGKLGIGYSQSTKQYVELSPSPALSIQQKRVSDLNAFLAQFEFAPFSKPFFTRIFNLGDHPNFDFDMGGRLYDRSSNSYQSSKSAMRQSLKINGEETVEIDISASHFRIFCAALGEPLSALSDPYVGHPLDRAIAKHTVNLMLTQQDALSRWPKGFKDDLHKKGRVPARLPTARQASAIMIKAYPILGQLKSAALDWSKLQYIESEILFDALETLRDTSGVPALPVHDSIIVPASKADLATDVLRDSFAKHVKAVPLLKRKALGKP